MTVAPASSRPEIAPALPALLKPLMECGSTSTVNLNSSPPSKFEKLSVVVLYPSVAVPLPNGSTQGSTGLAKPVVVGPYTANFADITRQLLDAGAAVQVGDREELQTELKRLFSEPDSRDRMGLAGRELVQKGQGAVERTLAVVRNLFIPEAG